MRAKQIQQALKPLLQSSSQVFLGQGLHTLGLLGWILEQTGAAQVAVTTFSTSDAFLCGMINLRKRGMIQHSTLVADVKASAKTLKLSRLMTEAFDEVKLTLNHSKIILVANDKWLVTVITSQNQTYGDRAECTFITTDRDVYLDVRKMLNDLLDDTTQFPYLEENKLLLQGVYDLGRALTPVEQVPILIDLSDDESSALKLELQESRSPYRKQYLLGLAETANELRTSNIALAKVGSPGAYHAVMSELSQIIANLG